MHFVGFIIRIITVHGHLDVKNFPKIKWQSTTRNLKAAEKNAGTSGKKSPKDAKLKGD